MERRPWMVAMFVSFLASVLVIVLVFLGWAVLWRPEGADRYTRLEAQALQEKQKTISALGEEITRIRKELEEGSSQIAKLQARLDDASFALRSAEQRLKIRSPADARSSASIADSRESAVADSRRETQVERAHFYETIRTTSVYREPSALSSKIATIPRGTLVRVFGATGQWLEVRSRHGKPPGFIHREDARFVRSGDAADEALAQASPSVR